MVASKLPAVWKSWHYSAMSWAYLTGCFLEIKRVSCCSKALVGPPSASQIPIGTTGRPLGQKVRSCGQGQGTDRLLSEVVSGPRAVGTKLFRFQTTIKSS